VFLSNRQWNFRLHKAWVIFLAKSLFPSQERLFCGFGQLFKPIYLSDMCRVTQSVWWQATGWKVRGSNPGGGEIFRTCPDRPWGPASLLYNGYWVFPGDKERPVRDADPSPLLVPWSRKNIAIPLLHLWAVRPVQRLSAYTRVHFTFTFTFQLHCGTHSSVCGVIVILSSTNGRDIPLGLISVHKGAVHTNFIPEGTQKMQNFTKE